MRSIFRSLFAGLTLALGAAAFGADYGNVSMACIPVGVPAPTLIVPLRISLSNTGSVPANAVVSTGLPAFPTNYPVTVNPGKNSTSLTVYGWAMEEYPRVNSDVYQVRVRMTATGTDGSKSASDFSYQTNVFSDNVLVIGERGAGFDPMFDALRATAPRDHFGFCPTELAPERSVGFRMISSVIVVGDTSKMSPAAADALRSYVLAGGTVAFVGIDGRDSQWSEIVKPHGVGQAGLGQTISLSPDFYTHLKGTSAGVKESGYYADHWALDAFCDQLNRLSGATVEIDSLVPAGPNQVDPNTGAMRMQPTGTGEANPFTSHLPPFGRVLFMLCAYFVMVVPVNLLVLKKLQKPELAWISAPALSVLFAMIVFSGRGELTKSGTCSSTRGVLVAQDGVPTGVFHGSSELFFPAQSSSDLNLTDADQVSPGGNFARPGLQPTTSFYIADDGKSAHVPEFHSASLSFSNVDMTQRVQCGSWFSYEVGKPDSDGLIAVKVRNNSPYTLRNVQLFAGGVDLSTTAETLRPGEALKEETMGQLTYGNQPNQEGQNSAITQLKQSVTQHRRIMLTAEIEDAPFGARVGTNIEDREDIELYAFGPQVKETNQ